MIPESLNQIAVFGAGGFGLEVAMLIEQINTAAPKWRFIGFFDDNRSIGQTINEWPLIGGSTELNEWQQPLAIVFAIGMPQIKETVVSRIKNLNLYYPILIHPSVIMGSDKYVKIGEGSIICAGNIITTNIDMGRHVILNLSCTIGHNTVIGDYCSFMPTCNISGEVKIGKASYWGTGAKVINGISVGEYTVIGAGAVVIRDIASHATAIGVPAKVIKQGLNR